MKGRYWNVYYKVNGLSYIDLKAVSEEEADVRIKEWADIQVEAYKVTW